MTVQAGIRLHDLNDELFERGLALPNLGDIDVQSIAGATSTATHGTASGSATWRPRSSGSRSSPETAGLRADEEHDPELLRVARVGLGALGILTEVTLRCVPAFNLHAVETIEPLTDVLADFGNVMRSTDHVEFYMMPGGRRCQVKRNTRTTEPAQPQSTFGYVRDKWIGENLAFGTVCRVGRRFPALAPKVAKLIMSAASERDIVDRSDRVFCSPRHVHFVEMEYGIPFDAVPDALGRIVELASRAAVPADVPDRGACVAGRRHPVVDRQRSRVGLDRRAPVHRRPVRALLPGGRADHERLRRPPPLGQDALPVPSHAGPSLPASGTRSSRGATSSTRRARSATPTSTGSSANPDPLQQGSDP